MKDEGVNQVIRNFVRNHPDIEIDRYSNKGGFGELYFGKNRPKTCKYYDTKGI